jgi:hypothetical protein
VFGGARRRFAPASANRRGAEREDISGGYNYQTCITDKKVFCCTGLDDPAQASFSASARKREKLQGLKAVCTPCVAAEKKNIKFDSPEDGKLDS